MEDSSHDPTNDTLLETFLCDPQSISLLSHPFEPFKDPTPATKSWLDSQIASLTASSNPSLGPIKDLIQTEFKADSEWLSTTFRIDHGAALRLVILGYQRRPRNSLANIGTRSSTTATNLTNTGNPYSSSQPHRASFGRSTLQSNEDTQSAHRELLAHLFYEERIGLLRCAVYLSEAGLRRSHPETRSRWVEKVGRTIINTHAKGAEYDKTGKHFLVECVDAILRRVGELEDGAPWQTGDKDSPFSSSSDWITYQLRQTMVIQDLIHVLVENTADLLPSSVVLSWFRCLADTSFFETTPTVI